MMNDVGIEQIFYEQMNSHLLLLCVPGDQIMFDLIISH